MINFNNHTHYTYQDSIVSIGDLISICKNDGQGSFCITDTNSVISYIKAFNEAARAGLRFIPGIELFVKPSPEFFDAAVGARIKELKNELNLQRTIKEPELHAEYTKTLEVLLKTYATPHHSVNLIALNNEGLKNLIRIFNSQFDTDEDNVYLSDPLNILEEEKEGLALITGFATSEPIYYIRRGMNEKALEMLREYSKSFKDNFYVQIEPYGTDLVFDESDFDLLSMKESYKILVDMVKTLGLNILVGNDLRYIEENEGQSFNIFRGINRVSRVERGALSHYMNEDSLTSALISRGFDINDIQDGIRNAELLEDKCEDIVLPNADPLVDRAEELKTLAKEGWENLRKGTSREQESWDRLEFELNVINGKNFSEYFIKVNNIVKTAKALNILVGPGRGSGCGCEVAFVLGITSIDPLKYGLFFERFMNPDRNDYPDFDIDLASVPMTTN